MLRAVASQILSGTWANKPSSAALGSLYFATDVGTHGTMFQYGVSRWRASNGVARLAFMGANSAALANSETQVAQTLIPAGAWQTGDILTIKVASQKSGATDTGLMTIRVGTLGTTGDTAITGLSGFALLATSGRTGGAEFGIKLVSATSALRVGSNATTTSGYQGTSGSAITATTITDASANALYVSIGFYSGGTTDTLTVNEASITLVTP